MDKNQVTATLNEALDRFRFEVESWMTSKPTSFTPEQKEEIHFLMKQTYYTLDDFKTVIEKLKD